jgi:hypothetical protein
MTRPRLGQTDNQGPVSCRVWEFFFARGSTAHQPATARTLGPCPGIKRPRREAENHLHILPKLSVRGAIHQLHHTFTWRCTEIKQTNILKSSLFWDVTQRRLVVSHRRFGTTYRSPLQGQSSPRRMLGTAWYAAAFFLDCLTFEDGPYRLSWNVEYTLRNIPEERWSNLHCCRCLKSRNRIPLPCPSHYTLDSSHGGQEKHLRNVLWLQSRLEDRLVPLATLP